MNYILTILVAVTILFSETGYYSDSIWHGEVEVSIENIEGLKVIHLDLHEIKPFKENQGILKIINQYEEIAISNQTVRGQASIAIMGSAKTKLDNMIRKHGVLTCTYTNEDRIIMFRLHKKRGL